MKKTTKKEKEPAARVAGRVVKIKFGDIEIFVESDKPNRAKKDALELFDVIEKRYKAHWREKLETANVYR